MTFCWDHKSFGCELKVRSESRYITSAYGPWWLFQQNAPYSEVLSHVSHHCFWRGRRHLLARRRHGRRHSTTGGGTAAVASAGKTRGDVRKNGRNYSFFSIIFIA